MPEKIKQENAEKPIEEMNIYERLSHIQNEMKVPKDLYNKFGNYYYRNAETIMETAKPICAKYRTTLTVTDSVKSVGNRYYVVSEATLQSWDNLEDSVINVAYAREDEQKKGMDGAQVTGSTSSYARKYALNGLFNLDDVKDSDTPEQKSEAEERDKQKKSEPKQASQPTQGQKKFNRHEVLSKVREFEDKCEKVGVNIYSEVNKALIRSEIGDFKDIASLDNEKLIKYGNILISMINGKLSQQKNGKTS